jgi:hypothetical protein
MAALLIAAFGRRVGLLGKIVPLSLSDLFGMPLLGLYSHNEYGFNGFPNRFRSAIVAVCVSGHGSRNQRT